MGLRKQQKLDRSRRILKIARSRFHNEGYEAVTIESIAAEAGLSAVTIYNYYGSKANLLLELVRESDVRLIEKLHALKGDLPEEMIDGVAEFGTIMRYHAMTYLTKPTWREVLVASILQGGAQFGTSYRRLDGALIDIMTELRAPSQKRCSRCRTSGFSCLSRTTTKTRKRQKSGSVETCPSSSPTNHLTPFQKENHDTTWI